MTRAVALARLSERAPVRHWPLLLLAAVALTIGVGAAFDRAVSDAPPRLDPVVLRPGYGPRNFAEARVHADVTVDAARRSLASAPREWLRSEGLARALIARWRLSGDYADLAEADRLLDAALAATPDPAGPVLSRAVLSGLVHRLDEQQRALARFDRSVAPDSAEIADAATLRGDIAFQRGELGRAAVYFVKAERIAASPGGGLRSAMLRAEQGDRRRAVAELETLLAMPRQQPAVLAALMLQRANLAYWHGDWVGAGRWVGAAQRAFPDWWLADAYAAQQFALAGREVDAIRAYRIVAERTRRPEVMDALAHLLRLQGRAADSRAWAAQAAARWSAQAALFPEAVAHHRVEHELAVGSAAAALALARADAADRPQAPNLVLLARALLSAGRAREARAALDRADAQGWVSAAQAMARSEVEAALGNTAASRAARAKAEAINPRAADPRTRLIWFGHD